VLAEARGPKPERSTATQGSNILAIPATAWINQPADNTDIELTAQTPTGLNNLNNFR